MGRCVITRGRQALELRSNLSERRSLTDPIQNCDQFSSSYSLRNLQWALAHGISFLYSHYFYTGLHHAFHQGYSNHWTFVAVLPESLFLQFDCGVRVQLGFAAEFSNVMVIYTRILEKPEDIVSCSAQLTNFPLVCSPLSQCNEVVINDLEYFSKTLHATWRASYLSAMQHRWIAGKCLCWQDVDIDLKKSNQESLHEAGCLLLNNETVLSPEVLCRYTRIRSLQRLKVSSFFSIDGSEKHAVMMNLCVTLEMRGNFNQLKTKHTKTVFLGGAYFRRLPLLHLCQHGWRRRRKTTGDGRETTCLQTLPAWTSAVSVCVLRLEPRLALLHRDVFLHRHSKLCRLHFKYSVTLCPRK